jgi:hypothetical protein
VTLAGFMPKDGGVELYLRKETNERHECMVRYAKCDYCVVPQVDVRKAYLIIQAEDWLNRSAGRCSEVFVAELSLEALEVLASALPDLRSTDKMTRDDAVEEIEMNTSLSGKNCIFVIATVFDGLSPYGDGHWFFGLTHAPRQVTENGAAWLTCPYAENRMLLLRETLHFDG